MEGLVFSTEEPSVPPAPPKYELQNLQLLPSPVAKDATRSRNAHPLAAC